MKTIDITVDKNKKKRARKSTSTHSYYVTETQSLAMSLARTLDSNDIARGLSGSKIVLHLYKEDAFEDATDLIRDYLRSDKVEVEFR